MGAYKVYKRLPLIFMIFFISSIFISTLILLVKAGSYIDRVLPTVLIIWVLSVLAAVMMYFFMKISISAMVVNTDTLLNINDCLQSMANRNFHTGSPNTGAFSSAPASNAGSNATVSAPVFKEKEEPLTSDDKLATEKLLSTICTSKAPDGIKKIKLSALEDELKEYHKFFYLNPTSESVAEKSFEYSRNTATGTAAYHIDCYGDNRIKRVEIKYSDMPMGILANRSWMSECIYKKEQALSRYESTAASCYCDLEILHCVIGDGNLAKDVLEATVLDQICTLETQAVNGWKISVSASGNAVTIVADHPTTVI